MDADLLKKLSKNLTTNSDNYMNSFRKNLSIYLSEKGISLASMSEAAGISYETLKSVVYGDSKDCKLSTAVALAKALGISVDELIGSGTIEPNVRESIVICRNLPDTYVRFVRWAIRYYERMLTESKVSKRAITVMIAESTNEGNVLLTNNFEVLDISDIPEIVRPKVFMGIKLPCDNYMPIYGENDILLIANDRKAMPSETAVIIFGGFMWLAKRKEVMDEFGNKVPKYFSIRDGKFRVDECDVEEVVGYVAGCNGWYHG